MGNLNARGTSFDHSGERSLDMVGVRAACFSKTTITYGSARPSCIIWGIWSHCRTSNRNSPMMSSPSA